MGVKEVAKIRDKFIVKKCVLTLFMTVLIAGSAQAQSSRVFSCHFTDEINPLISLRMKDYFDANLNMEMGKVDLMIGLEVKETTRTQVLEVPIWDSDTYIKMWYAPSLRVDAQMSWSSSTSEFQATYMKNSLKRPIYCTKMHD